MYYQKEHGRRYKVVNGSFLGRMSDGYAYCFDMESELFIADSSPVTVSHGGKSASGIVVACEDFQITVLLEQDIGEKLPVADIQVEPWKLLEALNARLAKMTSRNEIALSLMRDGPGLATSRPVSDVATGQDTAKACVRNQPITVIWGPPGTGKTYTMAEIAISHITSGKRVLVVSHSNISVDGVVAKVAELMRARGMDRRHWRGDVMRFGHVRDDALAQDEDVVSYLHALGSDPDRKKELEGLYDERDRLRRANGRRTLDMTNVQNKICRLRASIDEDEKYCVGHARLVATTVSKLYANSFFEDRTYDLVMFDEVSMAYVPQVVCAAMHASERLVIVGDFRQLPPIVQSGGAKRELSRDIFTYLGIIGSDQVAHYHLWLVMLDDSLHGARKHPGGLHLGARVGCLGHEHVLQLHEHRWRQRDRVLKLGHQLCADGCGPDRAGGVLDGIGLMSRHSRRRGRHPSRVSTDCVCRPRPTSHVPGRHTSWLGPLRTRGGPVACSFPPV